MVTVDQMMIKDIPSSAVPYITPVCEYHNVITYLTNTVKDPDEKTRVLSVLRYFRCDECKKNGIADIAVINARKFS